MEKTSPIKERQPPHRAESTIASDYLNNRPHFLWVYRSENPRGMLGEHEKRL